MPISLSATDFSGGFHGGILSSLNRHHDHPRKLYIVHEQCTYKNIDELRISTSPSHWTFALRETVLHSALELVLQENGIYLELRSLQKSTKVIAVIVRISLLTKRYQYSPMQ